MEPNSLATWELKVDNLRVDYNVEGDNIYIVYIQAVGVKIRNRSRIGMEEIEL